MSDKKEIEFVDGLIAKKPHENAPGFVVCNLSIKRKDLGNWLRNKTDDWINVDIKISKSGKYYAAVDSWKPNQGQMDELKQAAQGTPQVPDFDDDLPF